ncbi:MAG: ATP-binding protein [Rhodospirillales bacterium]|nr:ATP-binding protein [Rhodospirillales bacterium]
MHLDTRTISIVIVVVGAFLSATMLVQWMRHRGHFRYAMWAAGNGSLAVGWLLLSLRGNISPFLSIVLANTLIALCHAFLLNGVQRFRGFRLNWYTSLGVVAAVFAGQLVWVAIEAPVTVRLAYVPALLSIHALLTAWYLLRRGDDGVLFARRLTAVVFLALGLLYIMVSVRFLIPSEAMPHLFAPSSFVTALFLGMLVGMICWSVGFLSMVEQRHQEELQAVNAGLEERIEARTREAWQSKDRAETANRVKSEFLANMSHELRTPLNAVIGFSDALRSGICEGDPEKTRGYLDDIHASGTHLHEIINDILDVAAIESGRLDLEEEPVALADIVASAIRLVCARAERGNVNLINRIPEDAPPLLGDARRLKQVFINLLSNAVKFTPPGGTVTVDLRAEKENGIVVSVSDTGIGMDEAGLAVAMEPFGQVEGVLSRKNEGTGLGLPLTRALVEAHDATLSLSSAPGEGTVAEVHFPKERMRLAA